MTLTVTLPSPGGDIDEWGGILNSAITDIVDAVNGVATIADNGDGTFDVDPTGITAYDKGGADGAFVSLADGGTIRGTLKIRPDDTPWPGAVGGVVVKPFGDGTSAAWDLIHDDALGYGIHFTGGGNFGNGWTSGDPLAIVAIGTNPGHQLGTGLLVSNKGTGGANGLGTFGIALDNQATATNLGFIGTQKAVGGTQANALIGLQTAANNVSPLLVLTKAAGFVPGVAEKLLQARYVAAGVGTDAGYVRSDTGELDWLAPVRAESGVAAPDVNGGLTSARLSSTYGANQVFHDGVLNATTTLVSASAAFTSGDVGKAIWGSGIPDGTTVAAVTNATTITLSNPTTLTATGTAFALARTRSVATDTAGLFLERDTGLNSAWTSFITVGNGSTATELRIGYLASPSAPGGFANPNNYLRMDHSGSTTKLGLYNTPPVAQPARVGQLTDSSGGTSGAGTIAAVTDVATAANAIATLAAKVNAIESKLSAAGGGIGITA